MNSRDYIPTSMRDSSLQEAVTLTARAEQAKRLKAMTEGPVWETSKDSIGMPQESPQYASHKCNTCYGKGWLIRHTQPVASPDGARYSKFHVICNCVNKGYVKTRKKIESEMAHGFTLEQAAARIKFKL